MWVEVGCDLRALGRMWLGLEVGGLWKVVLQSLLLQVLGLVGLGKLCEA